MHNTGTAGLIESYRRVCSLVEEEFARNRRLHGARIQCRAGCSDCCHQLFQITEIEAAYISRGVRAMPPEARLELVARAKPYLEARQKLVAAAGEPEAWGSLPAAGTRLACPALDGGACRIYEHRPLICRKFGIPLYNPDKPGLVYACELNFKDGEEIVDSGLIRIQTGIHAEWKNLQGEYNSCRLPRVAQALTVARAILEDFSDLAGA